MVRFDVGLISNGIELRFSGVVKSIFDENPSTEGGIPVGNVGPITQWSTTGTLMTIFFSHLSTVFVVLVLFLVYFMLKWSFWKNVFLYLTRFLCYYYFLFKATMVETWLLLFWKLSLRHTFWCSHQTNTSQSTRKHKQRSWLVRVLSTCHFYANHHHYGFQITAKVVLEYLELSPEATYEDLIQHLQSSNSAPSVSEDGLEETTIVNTKAGSLTEEMLLLHAQYVVDKVEEHDLHAEDDDWILSLSPAMRVLQDLSGLT